MNVHAAMRDWGREWLAAQEAGDDQAAHAIADQVLAARPPASHDDPALPYHRRWVWTGTPVDDAIVLVRCYHGLGDTLMFARFLPALARRARHVTVEVQPALLPLLQHIAGVAHWHPFDERTPVPPAPCTLEIMELAHALRAGPADAPYPYLRAPPEPGYAAAIGVCTRAGNWDPARTLPAALLTNVLAGRRVVALEPGPPTFPAENPCGAPPAIEDLARLIAGLAHVVTVDTMVAHLTGALGTPSSVLLKHDPDWRWRSGNRWYPKAELICQRAPGDWPSAISRLRA